jgi:4-amino-4-deoxy-L-arabinose transferase-like glycosyltransferase
MTQSLAVEAAMSGEVERTQLRVPWGPIALAAVLLAYALLLSTRYAPAISEPDDNGYFAQGTLLAQTGRTWFTPASDAQYIGMHWLITPRGHYISRYPPGLAVIIGAVYLVGGWQASLLVNPALSVLSLIGVYLLCRRLVATGWALCAVVLLAINPTFVHHALAGDSHMGVTACVAWGLYWLVQWSQEGRIRQVFLAGLVLGCIPTIRYPDAVMALGIGLFLLMHRRHLPSIGRHYLAAVVGAAIPIVPLLIRNQMVMGAFWRTGYSLTNEQTGFSWQYFTEHALNYVTILHSGGVGLLLALGVVGLVHLICRPQSRALGLMLTFMAVPMLLLYMAYYWAPAMGASATMRFILPTFVVYVLAGVWVLSMMAAQAPRAARLAVPAVVVAVQFLWGAAALRQDANRLHYQKQSLAQATKALQGVASRGDVVIGSNNLLQQLDFVREWKVADASYLRGGMGGPGGGPGGPGGPPVAGTRRGFGGGPSGPDDPDAPSPMQQQKRDLQREKYSGTTDQRWDKFIDDVLAWADGGKVWFIGTETELTNTLGSEGVKIVARVPLPEMPQMSGPGGPGMGGPGMGGRGRGGQGGGFQGPPGGPGGNFGGPGGNVGGQRGNFPGRGGPGGGPGGPGGGPMRGFAGERELVIAQWIVR